VETLIRTTLETLARDGVPLEQVEASLHQLELSQREITGDSHPYGLQLIIASLGSAVHGGDPLNVLDIDPALAQLRQQIRDPEFIKGLIRRLLLDNPHHVVLTMTPDAHLAARQMEAEIQRLQAIKDSLSEQDTQQILARSQQLAARQEAVDDPSLLPKVGLADVPADLPQLIATQSLIGVMPVSFYAPGTNGLCYQQIVVDLPALDDELLQILPYYASSCRSSAWARAATPRCRPGSPGSAAA